MSKEQYIKTIYIYVMCIAEIGKLGVAYFYEFATFANETLYIYLTRRCNSALRFVFCLNEIIEKNPDIGERPSI